MKLIIFISLLLRMLEECAVWTCKIVNSQIPFNADYLSFVCAILNKYLKPHNSSNLHDELVPCKIFHLPKQHNHLKERIDQQGLDKKKPPEIASHLLCAWFFFQNFPQTTGLGELTLGIYQIKLRKTHTKEHLKDGGEYGILVNKSNKNSWERSKVGMSQTKYVNSGWSY